MVKSLTFIHLQALRVNSTIYQGKEFWILLSGTA